MSTIHALPLFPLGIVLYPGERVPLHIFEEQYKELVQYCIDHEVPFGIVLFNEGEIARMGSTARIREVINRYDDGRMDVLVEGEQRFRLGQLFHHESYLTADVEIIEESEPTVDIADKERVITQHMKLLELAGRTVRPTLYQRVNQLSFALGQNAGLDMPQKQELLELPSESERIHYLIHHFERLIPRIEQREDVRRRIRSNGHFSDMPPDEL